MKIRPVILDDAVKERVKEVMAHAEVHRFSIQDIFASMKGDSTRNAGHGRDLEVLIHFGVRVIYSIEQQPMGWCRHISISVSGEGNYPHEIVVDQILELFGIMTGYKSAIAVWDEGGALNFLFPFRTLAKAALIKLNTDDGNFHCQENNTFVGKEYQVDIETRRRIELFNLPHQRKFECDVIDALQDDGKYIFFPVELLQIEEST